MPEFQIINDALKVVWVRKKWNLKLDSYTFFLMIYNQLVGCFSSSVICISFRCLIMLLGISSHWDNQAIIYHSL